MNHEGDQNMQPNTEEMDTREAEAQPTLDNGLHIVNNKVEDNDVVMASSRDETNNSSAAENNEESGEEDEARSSATFQFTVENFSKLKESALSPQCFVRSLPWKIMVMSRVQQNDRHNQQRTVGIFLQCNAESESTWSCQASADLRLISCKPGVPPHGRKIQHLFYNKENDWGFSNFLAWNEIMDPEKGYYNAKEDSITVQVNVVADAPHGVSWDSKKHTGYVGLKNQGATCYMNSLLQTLFFTNQLRKAVYLMPTDNDDPSKSVALGLQRVFYDLQFGDKPVGTKKLTKSFGWDAIDSFMQHDVQELCRVLLDNMESKMKGTCVEGTIPRLFEGKMLSFIKCKHIEYMSSRQEPYYDIQLNIKGKKNIYESFKDYVTVENMDGENKYDAGDHGLQEAEKGVVFLSLPPVLVLQLMRFQYDPATDTNIKINDRCEFPTKLDLDPFLQQTDPNDPAHYVLHAVLVHSGDNHGGHYVVYINPRGDGKWCKFDDDVVSRATRKEATENNYGGNDDDVSIRFCTNAYMLTYLRESQLDKLVELVKEEDIPASLKQRFIDEKIQEAQKRKERLEAHLYLNVNIVLEDDFVGHQGPDLIDIEKCNLRTFKEKKTSTVRQLVQNLADALKYPVNQIRPWLFQSRKNNTFRPAHFPLEHYLDKTVEEVDDHTMTFFIETAKPGSKTPLPAFDKDREVLFFLKRYDPKTSSITYSGHICWPISRSLSDMRPMLCELSGYPKNSNLLFFEEVKPECVDPIEEPGAPLESLVEELMDGDIIIYQREDPDYEHYPLPTARDYFRDLYYRIEIIFYDRAQPTDPGFTLTLSQKDNYDRLARAVGDHLHIDPFMIQFFRPANPGGGGFGREVNYIPVRYTFDGTLKELFMTYQKPRTVRKLYYQKLTIRIDELENKRQLKCLWVSYNLKDEKELVLYPDKNGRVSDIFAEARKQLGSASAGQKLRMLEISSGRLSALVREDVILENFNNIGTKVYRIEEVPQDEATLSDDECLVPVAHFHKEPFQTFGTPFLFKVRNGELFSRVKERIQKRLEVPDKDFEKYRFAIVTSSRATFISEDDNYKVDIQSFIVRGQQQNTSLNMRPWLGLEHINKTVKRYNVSYQEKAIKILN